MFVEEIRLSFCLFIFCRGGRIVGGRILPQEKVKEVCVGPGDGGEWEGAAAQHLPSKPFVKSTMAISVYSSELELRHLQELHKGPTP